MDYLPCKHFWQNCFCSLIFRYCYLVYFTFCVVAVKQQAIWCDTAWVPLQWYLYLEFKEHRGPFHHSYHLLWKNLSLSLELLFVCFLTIFFLGCLAFSHIVYLFLQWIPLLRNFLCNISHLAQNSTSEWLQSKIFTPKT